jgi:hypothetical protein
MASKSFRVLAFALIASFAYHEAPAVSVSPQTALERLRAGDRRHQRGETINRSDAPPGRRLADGQWLLSTLLACSDCRVDPEDVFDLSAGNRPVSSGHGARSLPNRRRTARS